MEGVPSRVPADGVLGGYLGREIIDAVHVGERRLVCGVQAVSVINAFQRVSVDKTSVLSPWSG
jgi:hypothetical protein